MLFCSFPKINHLGCVILLGVTLLQVCVGLTPGLLSASTSVQSWRYCCCQLCQQISNISIADHLAEAESPWQTSRRRRGIKSKRHKERRYQSDLMPRAWAFSSLASLCSFLSLLCAWVGFKQRELGEKSTDPKHSCPLEAEAVGQTVRAGGRIHQSTWGAWEQKSCTQLCLLCAIALHNHVQFMELESFFLV